MAGCIRRSDEGLQWSVAEEIVTEIVLMEEMSLGPVIRRSSGNLDDDSNPRLVIPCSSPILEKNEGCEGWNPHWISSYEDVYGWEMQERTVEEDVELMKANLLQSIEEHHASAAKRDWRRGIETAKCFMTRDEFLRSEEDPACPIIFTTTDAQKEKNRKVSQMEDFLLVAEVAYGTLLGVFDGHSGTEAAQYVRDEFPTRFNRLYEQSGSVKAVFERIFREIQVDFVKKYARYDENGFIACRAGTTACVCYIEGNEVTTATVGDSEGFLWRKVNDVWKTISLSKLRDWSHMDEAKRAAAYMEDPTIAYRWSRNAFPKNLRLRGKKQDGSDSIFTVNLSRTIGDCDLLGTPTRPGTIQMPEVTVATLRPGDILLLVTDGITDYTYQNMIRKEFRVHLDPETLAERIVNTAKCHDRFKDDTSVIAARIFGSDDE